MRHIGERHKAKEKRLRQQDSGLSDSASAIDILSIMCLIVVVQLPFCRSYRIAASLRKFVDNLDSKLLALTHSESTHSSLPEGKQRWQRLRSLAVLILDEE